jgi:hypothetical protein
MLSCFVGWTTNCCETVKVFLYLFTTVTVERTCSVFRDYSYQMHKQYFTMFLSRLSSFLVEIVGMICVSVGVDILTDIEQMFYLSFAIET